MSHQAFLQAILETPDDDAPRLVYADWLDDEGDAERAEFIRLGCRLARLDEPDPEREDLRRRWDLLEHDHRHTWQPEVPLASRAFASIPPASPFRRGFVSLVSQNLDVFLESPERFDHLTPVE